MCPAVCIACRYVLWAGLGLGLVLTRSKLELRDGDDMRAHLAAYAASVCGVIAIGGATVCGAETRGTQRNHRSLHLE